MLIKAIDLRPGVKIEHNDDVWVVMEFMHRTPGKGNAVVQARIRSLTSGRSMNERFRSVETIALANLETRKMQYLYREGDLLTFMDSESYEQVQIDAESIGKAIGFLLENMETTVQFRNGQALGIDLPSKVVLKVTETEPAVRGDTVSNVTKPATTETGYVVQVPLFVNEGDSIRINTETGEYVERA
jgi:elongation factor P